MILNMGVFNYICFFKWLGSSNKFNEIKCIKESSKIDTTHCLVGEKEERETKWNIQQVIK